MFQEGECWSKLNALRTQTLEQGQCSKEANIPKRETLEGGEPLASTTFPSLFSSPSFFHEGLEEINTQD